MRHAQLLGLFAVLLLMASPALAQRGKIAGTVTDAATGESLPGVNILIVETQQGTASDVDGFYFINNVRPGTYTLRISFVGYTEESITGVRVSTGLTATLDIEMREQEIGLDEIIVVSERPIVQLDVSANVASLNAEAFEDLPVAGVTEVLDLQAGIEPGLRVRGGGLSEVAFVVDGMNLRTGRSHQPFTNISYTSLEEVQVQTGGFNAEYGNVRSGIVNVTSKEPSRTRYNVDALMRYIPAQPKSLEGLGGTNLDDCDFSTRVYGDCDNWFIRPFLDPDVAMDGTESGAWDSYKQLQYNGFEGWTTLAERLRNDEGFDVTAQDMQDYFKHTHRKDNAITVPDYEADVSVSGPLVPGLSSQLGDLRFLVSYRGTQRAYLYPQSREAFNSNTFQAKLVSNVRRGMKLTLNAMQGTERGINQSQGSADLRMYSGNLPSYPWWGAGAEIVDGINRRGRVILSDGAFPLADIDHGLFGATFTHTLSASTFYEVSLQNLATKYRSHFPNLRDGSYIDENGNFVQVPYTNNLGRPTEAGLDNYDRLTEFGGREDLNGDGVITPYVVGDEPFGFLGQGGNLIGGAETTGGHWVKTRDTSDVSVFTGRFDLTSQLTRVLQLKTGAELIISDYDLNYQRVNLALVGPEPEAAYPFERTPIQGAAYAQGKLEFQGMIANLGLRLDFFDANSPWWVAENPYDAAFRQQVEGLDELLDKEDPAAQIFVSPRLGISFPITLDSKLYFNYGHFRQMLNPFDVFGIQQSRNGGIDQIGNPSHPMPLTVAYELGFDQNIADQFLLRISGYYRDIQNQPRGVTYRSLGSVVQYTTREPWNYRDVRGAEVTLTKTRGSWVRGFLNYTYLQTKGGNFGYGQFNENTFEQRNYLRTSTDYRIGAPLAEPFARGNLLILTPTKWMPSVLNGDLLGDWRISLLGEWRAGTQWTWSGGAAAPPELQENVRWRSFVGFDLRFTKHINTQFGAAQLFLDVDNVFNRRHLYSATAFHPDNRDFDRYMWSLHLPADIYDELNAIDADLSYSEKVQSGGFPYIWVPGNDKPGVFRHPDVDYQPVEAVGSLTSVQAPSSVAWYWAADTETYSRWNGSSWDEVPQNEVDQMLEDKAYIDMPNLRFNTFLNIRRVTMGVRLTF